MALETLGGVCAVGQLAGQCAYVLEVVDKVRRSTETLKGYQTQIQDLRLLCEVIKRNPLLQTKEVISHTQLILKTTEQHDDLTLLLQKRRLHRIWTFLRVERRLVEQTKNIETLKSALLISIQDQQCLTLHNIDKRTQTTAMMQSVKEHHDDGNSLKRSADVLGQPSYEEMQMVRYGNRENTSEVPPESEHPSGTQPSGPTNQDCLKMLREIRSEFGPNASVWLNNTAREGVNQLNGVKIMGVTKGNVINARHQVWAGNHKAGRGHQQNGFQVMGNIDGYVPMPEIHGGAWYQFGQTNDQDGDVHTQGRPTATQHNAHTYGFGPGRRKQRKNRSRGYH